MWEDMYKLYMSICIFWYPLTILGPNPLMCTEKRMYIEMIYTYVCVLSEYMYNKHMCVYLTSLG